VFGYTGRHDGGEMEQVGKISPITRSIQVCQLLNYLISLSLSISLSHTPLLLLLLLLLCYRNMTHPLCVCTFQFSIIQKCKEEGDRVLTEVIEEMRKNNERDKKRAKKWNKLLKYIYE
jgi:hypothetical protein